MSTSAKLKNESGVILVTVIIVTMILSVVTIGLMSLSRSQVTTASSVVSTIQAEMLATGLFYQDYQNRIDGNTATLPTSITVGTKNYTVTRTTDTAGSSSQNFANQVQFNITY